MSTLNSVAKIQPQNPDVNTLNASALANKIRGSFAKNGTIDYLCWAKKKMFLLASRNVSDREQKIFSPRIENLLTANRKSVETIEKSLSPMRIKKSKHVHHDRGYYRPTRGNFGREEL